MRECQRCGFPADDGVRRCPKCDADLLAPGGAPLLLRLAPALFVLALASSASAWSDNEHTHTARRYP